MPSVSNDYQRMIFTMKYSRSGRETWYQAVSRLSDFITDYTSMTTEAYDYFQRQVIPMIQQKKVMPSMRLLASAGNAAAQENLMAFNCMFMGVKSWSDLGKLMYALMCGTGVGFSVEDIYLRDLPKLQPENTTYSLDIIFQDSRKDWAQQFNVLVDYLVRGYTNITWDVSHIRPKGAPLVTTGGFASGPEPLVELVKYTIATFKRMRSTGVQSIYIYDLCCKIADVVVQGGVRRSACICLFDHNDQLMWNAKSPLNLQWFPHRANSNNSVVFPDEATALENISKVLESARRTGEPGVILKSRLQGRGAKVGRLLKENIGVNPCGEIILKDNQVCNLTEVILRPEDSLEEHMDIVEAAVFLGLLQAKLTDFCPELLKELKFNTDEEKLLGVSLTGLMDTPELLRQGYALDWLRGYAHECASTWAPLLFTEAPKAITCVKPSGTVSKLVDCSAGVHPRFSKWYLSNIGVATGTPLERFLVSQGVPVRCTLGATTIFSFPLKSPDGAITADTIGALDQLNSWSVVNDNWCDHNASCTIYVEDNEWPVVDAWCKANIGKLAGVTFMAKFTPVPGSYMPLEKLTEEEYNQRVASFPSISWDKFTGDSSLSSTREFACTGGSCELI